MEIKQVEKIISKLTKLRMIEHLELIKSDIKWQSTFIDSDFEWNLFLETVQNGKELFDKINRMEVF